MEEQLAFDCVARRVGGCLVACWKQPFASVQTDSMCCCGAQQPGQAQPDLFFEMVLTVCHVLCLHAADVVCLCTGGQWLASGSDDGSMRVWEVATGRCCCSWQLGEPVMCVAWCPNPKLQLLAAAVGSKVVLLPFGLAGDEVEGAAKAACQVRRALCALGVVFWFGFDVVADWDFPGHSKWLRPTSSVTKFF